MATTTTTRSSGAPRDPSPRARCRGHTPGRRRSPRPGSRQHRRRRLASSITARAPRCSTSSRSAAADADAMNRARAAGGRGTPRIAPQHQRAWSCRDERCGQRARRRERRAVGARTRLVRSVRAGADRLVQVRAAQAPAACSATRRRCEDGRPVPEPARSGAHAGRRSARARGREAGAGAADASATARRGGLARRVDGRRRSTPIWCDRASEAQVPRGAMSSPASRAKSIASERRGERRREPAAPPRRRPTRRCRRPRTGVGSARARRPCATSRPQQAGGVRRSLTRSGTAGGDARRMLRDGAFSCCRPIGPSNPAVLAPASLKLRPPAGVTCCSCTTRCGRSRTAAALMAAVERRQSQPGDMPRGRCARRAARRPVAALLRQLSPTSRRAFTRAAAQVRDDVGGAAPAAAGSLLPARRAAAGDASDAGDDQSEGAEDPDLRSR